MPHICYQTKKFRADSLDLIEKVNSVITEYSRMGYSLTLRQAYYQMVARGYIPNNQKSYKNLGNLINDARLAGLVDWNAIEDRTRNLSRLPHWQSPESIISACASQYRRDLWENQSVYAEVWVEKEALSNIVGRVSDELDVPYLCCRGYMSQSEMWQAANRFRYQQDFGKDCYLIHLGDHDPSGIDMSRDIQDRLEMFGVDGGCFYFNRIALNMNQIEVYSPPPNPAKITDSRCASYISEYGDESWELDALEPQVIHDLITTEINSIWTPHLVEDVKARTRREKSQLREVSDRWEDVTEYLCI